MAKDYTDYATRAITPTMEAFAEWLTKETGYKVDARTVALAGSLRADFQSSNWWKGHPSNYKANVEANREARAQERIAKAQESARKAQERATKLEQQLKASLAKAQADAKAKAAKAAA
jgi:hypothetical protein